MIFCQLHVLSFQEELHNEPVSANYKKCQLYRLTVHVNMTYLPLLKDG